MKRREREMEDSALSLSVPASPAASHSLADGCRDNAGSRPRNLE